MPYSSTRNHYQPTHYEANYLDKDAIAQSPNIYYEQDKLIIELDGESLTTDTLYTIGFSQIGQIEVRIAEESKKRVNEARKIVDDIVESGEVKYGINTGFGHFATTAISKDDLKDLQKNLIRSHASGIGDPIPIERARMLLALRCNILAKGYSGIRLETLQQMVNALNAGVVSYVPCKGTVGASGDLAPLAHVALGMMGEGYVYNPQTKQYEPAMQVFQAHNLKPIDVHAKEGLALINGTQFICALGSEALTRANMLCREADVISALTLEVLRGSFRVMDARIHRARNQSGQMKVARRMRHLLVEHVSSGDDGDHFHDAFGNDHTHDSQPDQYKVSEIAASHKNCSQVQDSYTLRCIPQVHGVVNDTIEFTMRILNNELNAATDNPMVFTETTNSGVPRLHALGDNERLTSLQNDEQIVSGGNFHGEYAAKALDYLAISIQELANISERRMARLVDSKLSGLPAFLVREGGLNSGFMIAHCTSASLTSENKVLVHPSSSDTLPTSANQEDHVSMGGFSSVKCLDMMKNVEYVLAIELMAACQALDLLRPLHTTKTLEKVYNLVRQHVPYYEKDRFLTPDIEKIYQLVREGQIWEVVKADILEQGQ